MSLRSMLLLSLPIFILLLLSEIIAVSSFSPDDNVDNPSEMEIPVSSVFPQHWGSPPLMQTKDLVPLPGNYGRGSSTLKHWILENMAKDDAKRMDSSSGYEESDANWPVKSLVGMTGEQAKQNILMSSYADPHSGKPLESGNIHILPEGALITMDYRTDRVRIFVGTEGEMQGRVVQQPKIG